MLRGTYGPASPPEAYVPWPIMVFFFFFFWYFAALKESQQMVAMPPWPVLVLGISRGSSYGGEGIWPHHWAEANMAISFCTGARRSGDLEGSHVAFLFTLFGAWARGRKYCDAEIHTPACAPRMVFSGENLAFTLHYNAMVLGFQLILQKV